MAAQAQEQQEIPDNLGEASFRVVEDLQVRNCP